MARPRACSGDIAWQVPSTAPGPDRSCSPPPRYVLARPKSRILARPAAVTITFDAFRSRCTMLLACASARPSAISRASWTVRSAARQAVAQHAIEGLALDQLHHDPVAVVGLDDVVDVDDRRVVEARRHPRLAAEAQLAGGVGGVRQQPLDGQRPLQGLVERAVDRAHAARAQALFDQVVADAIGNARSIVRPRMHGPQCTSGTALKSCRHHPHSPASKVEARESDLVCKNVAAFT